MQLLLIESGIPANPCSRGLWRSAATVRAMAIVFLLLLVAIGPAFAASCEELKGMKVSGGIVTAAEHIEKGSTPAGSRGAIMPPLPQYCRVTANLSFGPDSKIIVELWLPDPAEWNGKFLGTGNGGFAGSIAVGDLRTGIGLSYATANTNMGTAGGYAGGTGKPEMIKDWGWRSTHAMTLAGKEITQAYYMHPIAKSYFSGCSTGGHQALMEAQRYPEDYDGILAGAAGNNRIALHLAFLYYLRVAQDNPGYWMSREQGAMVRKAVLSRCAGQGSGLPTDDFVANPGTCDFKPESLQCKPGQDAAACLTAPQLTMLKKIYAGVQNLSNGHTIYPGNPFGTEASAVARLGTQGGGAGRGTSDLLNWAKGPAYNPATFDFNKDVEELYKVWGADINALSADLSAFRKRGGKLITYHGWQDTTVSPFDSINYYDRLSDAKSFVRLFMVPGMDHCQNGPGLDSFGTRAVEGQLPDPDHNIVSALDRWVTAGIAPEEVIATKWSGGFGGGRGGGRGGAVAETPAPPPPPRVLLATRPICAYPRVAQYKGSGDNTKAENYKCIAAPKAKFTPPAPEYLVNSGAFGH